VKKQSILMLLSIFLFTFFSGCSYVDIDNNLQTRIHQINSKEASSAPDGRAYVEDSSLSENYIDLKGIGGAFSAYKNYSVINMNGAEIATIEKGEEGVTYTLKSVQLFDSIYTSDVDMYGCQIDDVEFLESTPFILVEIEASYIAPSDKKKEIVADANEISGMAVESQPGKQLPEGMFPTVAYFSLRPPKDDSVLDYQHNFFSYRIKDGEPVKFQIGLFCGQSYIDNKNVYLEVNASPSIKDKVTGDTTRKLFVLFPESEE
jgi:hypothetical protein